MKSVVDRNGELINLSRLAELVIVSDKGIERERYPLTYGAHIKVQEGQEVEAGPGAGRVGPLHQRHAHGSGRQDQVRRHPGQRHGAGKGGPGDRQSEPPHHREPGPGNAAPHLGERRYRRHRPHPRHPGLCPLLHARGRHPHGERRRPGLPRRRHHQDPPGNHQDQGHHRGSAPGGRALRGAQTQGNRHHQRNQRGGLLRAPHQGQTQDHRHPGSGQAQGVPDPQRQARGGAGRGLRPGRGAR